MESEPTAFKTRSFGQIIGDSFETYFADIGKFIAIAAMVIVPVALCSGGLWALGDFARTAADGWSSDSLKRLVTDLLSPIGTVALTILAYPLMHGALIHATEQKRIGQSISIREAYLCALRKTGRLIGAWLLTGLLVSAMLASLICFFFALFLGDNWLLILTAVLAIGLPFALYFTIKWLFELQMVMLEESRVIESLQRSSALVAGNWWRSLGIFLVLSVAPSFILAIPFSLIFSRIGPSGFGAIVLQANFPSLVVVPLSAIAQTLLYFDLRARRGRNPSQTMGGELEVPPAPKLEYFPQVPSTQNKPRGRVRLKPALIAVAVVVILAGVITPTVLHFHNRADAGDTEVFVRRLSTGKEVRLGHGRLKTFEYTDFAFVVDFDGFVQAGEMENTVEIVGSSNAWSDGLARVQVYAEEGSEEEFFAPVQYDFHLPEDYPGNELTTRVEMLDEHHILVSSVTGSFPAASHIALILDYGTKDGVGYGYGARLFTL